MAKFAQYYSYFIKDLFGESEWNRRQQHFGALLEDEDSITFSEKPKSDEKQEKKIKIYKHKIYHIRENKDIIVMRLANVKLIPIEKDFKSEQIEHYPSVFIIIDNRENCRRVAIQKLSTSFSTTDQVAKILQSILGDAMKKQYNIGLELRAQRYTKDFYQMWKQHENSTTSIKFCISPNEESNARMMAMQQRAMLSGIESADTFSKGENNTVMGYIEGIQQESNRYGYSSSIEVMAQQRGQVMKVDETSEYIRTLAKYCSATATPVVLCTNDGGSFECFIDTDLNSNDKIITKEFDASYLEALFDSQLEDSKRKNCETKVIELLYNMRFEVDNNEKEVV